MEVQEPLIEKINKQYKAELPFSLKPMSESDSKTVVIDLEKHITKHFREIIALYPSECLKHSLYTPYKCDGTNDYGWGCAWRCI